MPTCEIVCDVVSLCDAVAMVIEAYFDLLEAIVAIWLLDYWQVNESTASSACLHAVARMNSERKGRRSVDLMILCLPQPLGSFSHMCPHGAGWLSRGSQLHLGDSEAGRQEDAFPGKSLRPVQSQLLTQHKFISRLLFSATDGHANHDWAKLAVCIDWRGEECLQFPRVKSA